MRIALRIARATKSEKSVGVLGGIFRSCPITSQKLPLCGNRRTQRILGQLSGSLLQNPGNFSELAPEVRPAVHTAALRLTVRRLAILLYDLNMRLLQHPVQEQTAGELAIQQYRLQCYHPAARGVLQKEFGKNVTKKVTEASEKDTKKRPNVSNSYRTPFATSFCGTLSCAVLSHEP